MLLSVFTPTHSATHLSEVWKCLTSQTVRDWEWVTLPNGPRAGAIADHIKTLTQDDSRVRIVRGAEDTQGIGALKRVACLECYGDVLVEVDHDDLIPPDCLESLAKEAAKATSPTFIFSDAVTCEFDGKCVPFGQNLPDSFGWRNYKATVLGKNYPVNETPPVTARSLCDILYTPDHVRAWTRDAYMRTGGHNPKLAVGDDHDLVSRTYLSGADFRHIKRPLYVHRLSPQTTSQQKLQEIADVSRNIRDQRTHLLVAEWCRRENLSMYDLGGAHDCPPGYIPVDENLPEDDHGFKADVFEFLYRLPNNSVGCFRAFDFLEHIPVGRVVTLLNLLYDKLVPGGWLLTHTPAVCDDDGRCGRGAYQDPTHVSYWSSNSWWYYTDRNYAKYVPDIRCRFQTVRVGQWYPSEFHKTHLIPYVIWDGIALKDDDKHYFPGPKSI